jgi:hypothetical protein
LLHFKWKNGQWSYAKRDNLIEDAELSAKDKDDIRTPLAYLEASEAQQMLGVHLSPDGNNDAQYEVMLEKKKHYGKMIGTGHIHKHEAWLALTVIAMKSLEYAVPALTLTQEQYYVAPPTINFTKIRNKLKYSLITTVRTNRKTGTRTTRSLSPTRYISHKGHAGTFVERSIDRKIPPDKPGTTMT